MIYLQVYLIISLFLTITTAYMLKDRFGSLENVMQMVRDLDRDFFESFEGITNRQLVVLTLITGFITSPIIAVYVMLEKMK
jgi:hypothetical protein